MTSLYAPDPSATEDCCLLCRQVYDITQEVLDPLDPKGVKWKHICASHTGDYAVVKLYIRHCSSCFAALPVACPS